MVPGKRNWHQQKHPFDDDYPFEAVLNGSWQPVELIKVESGKTSIQFMDTEQFQSPLSSNIRIKSRKATAYDCTSFLRPGIDITMLLGYCHHDNPNQFGPIPMWMDARINSIQRQPHEYDQCSCQFYVNLYDGQGSLGTELKTLDKEFKSGAKTKRYRSLFTSRNGVPEEQVHKDGTSLNADARKEIIDTYMKNFDSLPTEEEPVINEETSKLDQKVEENVSESDDVEENHDDLWAEFDIALMSSNLLDGTEDSNAEVLAESKTESMEICEHDYIMDEQIGIYCLRCGFVKTEIRHISEHVAKQCIEEDREHKSEQKVDEDVNNDLLSTDATEPDEPISTENDSVWELIPELKEKMHAHQIKAFEFLWQNIAGSMEPSLMKEKSETNGGCVISHAPGAGKTFLIISFLVSYLKLFPGKRPLILAPKTTLYTWRKEFKKWKVDIPMYLIHGHRTWKGSTTPKSMVLPGIPRPSSGVKHARARKFFLDNIEKKINSDIDEEKMQGLHVLRKITSGFIDVYDSGNSSDTLPGLQIYTLLMNTSDEQHEIVQKLQKKMAECTGYPLEVELLITLASIHPWLIKTAAACAAKFFAEEELEKLEALKFDLKKGSKVRFVLSLVSRVVKKEKVLIFCHNLAPVRFFIELFEKYFQWQNGKEILLLTGELDLFERGKVIDKFEDTRGSSKILLASINACAEGISLTAASRVIFLDSEWNPSKTKQAIARAFRPGQQKMVYVYQLLTTESMEEAKHRRTGWKEWISCMIFSEEFVEDPSKWQAQKIEDDILREMVEEDKSKIIHKIMKNEKASTS
ncbi:hypothetical protein TSUD_149800 [Trifolium subterraneum]|uniref:Helicase C-terminal domain-containing protein n=1 Tax=Trifolium subterraneum TaxID=3900 RepID=A0A2Z6N057_TRISU|nr:hypothetical protein TSUD_149800 [Trifolium subterraneum]